MSLATRCTACGTVFRVVQDQLKVSEGWVRCGRCSEVFNALEGLFDLERDTPPEGFAGAATPQDALAAESIASAESNVPAPDSAAADDQPIASEASTSTDEIDKIDAQLIGSSRESGHDSTPATRISERDRLEFPDAQFDPEMLAEDVVDIQLPSIHAVPPREPETAELAEMADAAEAAEPPSAPGFVQHAQRQARWNTPRMRTLQAAVVVVLMGVLGLQAAHHFRDAIAARWPDAMPSLAAWCSLQGCTIDAVRRIEDVAVESTALARASTPDAFRLSVVLRNRGTMVVALPSVDLSLTDVNGQLISRRMLAPRDFRASSTSMRPGAESALQLVLSAGSGRVTGYTVEVFYP